MIIFLLLQKHSKRIYRHLSQFSTLASQMFQNWLILLDWVAFLFIQLIKVAFTGLYDRHWVELYGFLSFTTQRKK